MTDADPFDIVELKQHLHRIHRGQGHWSKRLLAWLGMIRDQACQRRLNLFACACVRRLPLITRDPPSLAAIKLCEKYADGEVGRRELLDAGAAYSVESEKFYPARCVVRCLFSAEGEKGWLTVGSLVSLLVAKTKVGSKHYFLDDPSYPSRLNQARQAETVVQQQLLEDIFGMPRTGVTLLPAWRTPKVLQLARTIYQEHVPYLMPVLGKALHDAGCDNDVVLEHCQGLTPHVRGCWLLDLVLAEE